MALNRDEKDFLTQIGAAIVQSSKDHLQRIRVENEAHIELMKRVNGMNELKEMISRLEARMMVLERQTVLDRIKNLFRK